MSDFTYENASNQNKLETFEWDNTWIEHAENANKTRVLYIGDSISCGTRRAANTLSGGHVLFDGFGTSKALDNPVFFESLRLFASQEPKRDFILFNNGLHGWHMDDEGEYAEKYEVFIDRLIKEYPSTPIFILLTTYVKDQNLTRVQKRNDIALQIAKAHRLPVIDLYSVALAHCDLITDGVHFSPEGYRYLAQEILDRLGE